MRKKIYIYSLIITIIFNTIVNANILYDKNGIFVTDIDYNLYHKLTNTNKVDKYYDPKALKSIILIKKTIKSLGKKNKEYLSFIDNYLSENLNIPLNEESFTKNFYRYSFIRDEFMKNYINNKLSIKDIEIALKSIEQLKVPISRNDCMTIDSIVDVSMIPLFDKMIYQAITTKIRKMEFKLNGEEFDICMNEKTSKTIEQSIFLFLENVTSEDFNKFIYEKQNS